ncbi:TPA: WecB/TagA/CpsF family glycosyltransferase [Providencia alcalifaciens]
MPKFRNTELEKKMLCGKKFQAVLDSSLSQKGNNHISFVNPFSYSLLTDRNDLVSEIDYWFVDGSLLCFLTNRYRENKISRASFDFTSIADCFFSFAINNNLSIGLIGGTSDEIQKAFQYIRSRYPDLNIPYIHSGYIQEDNLVDIANEIKDKGIDLLICGMGTPLQEEFLIKISTLVNIKISITCGGFLTQTSLFGDYYHPLVKKLGLRWLQRAILHKHVRNRLLKSYPKFLFNYIFNKDN